MELGSNLILESELNNSIERNQIEFLNSTFGKAINNGIDIGLRYLLPDFLEDQIIELKNNIMQYGLKEGINQTINSAIDLGKSTLGIFTGNFENLSQVQLMIKNGGILDDISELLDTVIDKLYDNGKINNIINRTIKNGKNSILDSIENNIENTMDKQLSSEEKLDECIYNWKENYKKRDFSKMKIEYKKMKEEITSLIPIEEKIKEVRKIEDIHNLIKDRENKFDLTEDELELIQKLNV